MSDLEYGGTTRVVRPDPVGFRWYLHSSLPVSWLAEEVIPAVRYLLHTERMPVVNVRRGWRHGTHLEVIAHSDDGRPVPWTQVLARMRPPREEGAAAGEDLPGLVREPGREPEPEPPPQPHGTFEWIASSDFRPWPGHAQDLRERALTKMIDSMAVTLEPGDRVLLGRSAPLDMVAEIMLATADAHPLGVRYGVISFRSHAQRFLDRSGSASGLRPDFERRLGADRAALRSLVERMLDGTDSPSTASWRRTASYCMGLFDGAFLAGALSPEVLKEISGPPFGARPESGDWLSSYELMLRLLYVQLPLLGVSWRRKYYLSWAIAEIVDEMAG